MVEHCGARRHFDGNDLVIRDAGRLRRRAQIGERVVGPMELLDRR